MKNTGIIGVDEVGRGALAGHVMAAAVWWPHEGLPCIVGDSKKISALQRQLTTQYLQQHTYVAIGAVTAAHIDEINILQATLLAMHRAITALFAALPPQIITHSIMIDGNKLPAADYGIDTQAIIKGDAHVPAIGAASIVAKYTRDTHMQHIHTLYPHYGFNRHVGYGTAAHRQAIIQHGMSCVHRRSFLSKIVEGVQ